MSQLPSTGRKPQKSTYFRDPAAFPLIVDRLERKWEVQHIPHWHDEIEIIYQSKGYNIFTVSHKTVKLCEGQAIFINSGELHLESNKGDFDSEYYHIAFNPSILAYSSTSDPSLEKFIIPLIQKRFKLPFLIEANTPWEKDIITYLQSIIDIFMAKPAGYEFIIRVPLYGIFAQLILNNALKKAPRRDDFREEDKTHLFSAALDYIHNNYSKRIAVNDIASHIKMSPNHFCRFFKFLAGKSPIEYTNKYRIDKAVELLNTKMKISDIAMETGFESFNLFNSVFRKHKKCTPSEYRRLRCTPAPKDLPRNWKCQDIGDDIKPGWTKYNNGVYTLGGAGNDIWSVYDKFQFVYTEISGNFSITARITSIQNTHEWAKAGIMLRKTLSDDSPYIDIVATPSKVVSCQYRPYQHDGTRNSDIKNVGIPVYLKFTRSRNNFAAAFYSDGETWTQIGDMISIKMDASIYAGLAVTSHSILKTCVASFDSVRVDFEGPR